MVLIMNIRSIDLQVLIPRTTEVSKAQAITDRQGTQQQQQFAEQFQKITTDLQHQVQSTPKSFGGKVQREKNKSQHKQQNDGKKDDNVSPAEEENPENTAVNDQADPIRGHIIDIKT